MINKKVCSVCAEEKEFSKFNKHKLGKFGLNPVCTSCRTKRQKKSREENGYAAQIKYKYGITLTDVQERIKKQEYVCPICSIIYNSTGKRPSAPVIDHDHATGKIRGIVCWSCNACLGHIKDSVIILDRMKEYLNAD